MRQLVLVALMGLTGCSPMHYVPCPTLVPYSTADQAALAAEIQANPQPQTNRWIGDYIGLRDQVRACRNIPSAAQVCS